jgi:uncharacterized membrane protein YfcA
MVVPTAVAGLRGYVVRRQVRGDMVPCLVIGSIVTAVLGSLLSARLPGARLQQVFGALVVGLALHMLVRYRSSQRRRKAEKSV